MVSFPQVSPPKPCMHLSSPLYLLHAPLISFSIWSLEQYLVRSADHEFPHYAVLSIPLLPRPSKAQIFSSAPCSQTRMDVYLRSFLASTVDADQWSAVRPDRLTSRERGCSFHSIWVRGHLEKRRSLSGIEKTSARHTTRGTFRVIPSYKTSFICCEYLRK